VKLSEPFQRPLATPMVPFSGEAASGATGDFPAAIEGLAESDAALKKSLTSSIFR